MKTIADIIADREPYSVESGWSVRRVIDYLCEKRVGAVVITEGDRAVGVFSERDLMARVVLKGLDAEKVRVEEVMSKGIISVPPNEDYRLAKGQMLERRVRHLVVLDDDDKLRGLVSMRELLELDIQEYRDLVKTLNDRYYQSALKED